MQLIAESGKVVNSDEMRDVLKFYQILKLSLAEKIQII